MASNLKTQTCFVWETSSPVVDESSISPNFTLLSSEYFFTLKRIGIRGLPSDNVYQLFMIMNGVSVKNPNIAVITCLEDKKSDSNLHLSQSQIVWNKENLIWVESSKKIHKYIPDFNICGDFRFIFLFDVAADRVSKLTSKLGNNLNNAFTHSAMSLPSSFQSNPIIQNRDNHSARSSADTSTSQIGFNSLSQDITNMFSKNLMTDVQLRNGDRTIGAHKLILAARSEIFAAMFRNDMVESVCGIIDIKDMEFPVLEAFLQYLYSGKLPDYFDRSMVPELYAVASTYAVPALSIECKNSMVRNLNKNDFVKVLSLAEKHGDDKLRNSVIDFVVKNKRILKSDIWLKYSEENPNLAIGIYQRYVETTIRE